jgi:hypothetical protein
MSSFPFFLTKLSKYIIIYILIITNLISMLEVSDNYGQPDDDSNQPTWDRIPETQIVEITPDDPAPPPSTEQAIISDILTGIPEIYRLPEIQQSERVNSVN